MSIVGLKCYGKPYRFRRYSLGNVENITLFCLCFLNSVIVWRTGHNGGGYFDDLIVQFRIVQAAVTSEILNKKNM